MAFVFTKQDNIGALAEPIRAHIRTFALNRMAQYEILLEAVEEEDFEEIRLFCHAQLGVAASYHCFKLEEITAYIQELARKEVMKPIKEVLPVLKDYLIALKKESNEY